MWLPQASGGNRPGTLLSILQCPQPRNVWPEVSPVLRKAASVDSQTRVPRLGVRRGGLGQGRHQIVLVIINGIKGDWRRILFLQSLLGSHEEILWRCMWNTSSWERKGHTKLFWEHLTWLPHDTESCLTYVLSVWARKDPGHTDSSDRKIECHRWIPGLNPKRS